MDLLRSAYRTNVRPWRDSSSTIGIRWFRALPGAEIYPNPNLFTSLNWTDRDEAGGPVGEVKGAARPWDPGLNPAGFLGVSSCGTPAVFRAGATAADPVFLSDALGYTACCGAVAFVGLGGVEVGGDAEWDDQFFTVGGVEVGGEATLSNFFFTVGGVEAGGEAGWSSTMAITPIRIGPQIIDVPGTETLYDVPVGAVLIVRWISVYQEATGSGGCVLTVTPASPDSKIMVLLVEGTAGPSQQTFESVYLPFFSAESIRMNTTGPLGSGAYITLGGDLITP